MIRDNNNNKNLLLELESSLSFQSLLADQVVDNNCLGRSSIILQEVQVIKNFKEDPHHRFQVIEYTGQPMGPTVRLELALIEIDPSQPALHALSWAGPSGTGTAAGMINQRRAAFEGRLRDLQPEKSSPPLPTATWRMPVRLI